MPLLFVLSLVYGSVHLKMGEGRRFITLSKWRKVMGNLMGKGGR
jgi:CTP-dependent riboflavin kinase